MEEINYNQQIQQQQPIQQIENNNNNNNIQFTNYYYNLNNSNSNNIKTATENTTTINQPISNNELTFIKEYVTIKSDEIYLEGILHYNEFSKGMIIFIHGIGSSRFSPRNLYLSKYLQTKGYSTLLFDILTPQEERLNNITGEYKYNLNFISKRIISATEFINQNQKLKNLPISFFGSSTGSAAIIESENKLLSMGIKIKSIISRSGRLSLNNKNSLGILKTPILLICGSEDKDTLLINKQSLDKMHNCFDKKFSIIQGANHLYSEAGTIENVAEISFNFLNK